MSFLKGLIQLRTGLQPVLHTAARRSKATDVRDVVGWKFVVKPSKLTAQFAGDLAPGEPVDTKQPQLAVEAAKDVLESADAATQRVLSLEFARVGQQVSWLQQRAAKHVQRHRFDVESLEVKIARLTARMRHYRQLMVQPEYRRLRQMPVRLHEMNQQRHAALTKLRALDYRRFEWLLDQLQLLYRPALPDGTTRFLTRKSGIRQMVQLHSDTMRQQKLDALRHQFESEKPAFLEERRRAVAWIAAEERELGLPSSVDEEKGELLEPRLPRRLVVPPYRPDAPTAGQ